MLYNDKQCSQIISPYIRSKCGLGPPCPSYNYLFASWTTYGISIGSIAGNLMLETLEQNVTSFLVGCSNFSSQQPVGLAGFGSEPTSLPSQLGLTKFSFCCLSHEHDDVKEHQPCFGQCNYGRAQLHTIAHEPYVCRKLTFFRVPLSEA